MSFFGAVFAALTLNWQLHLTGILLALPFTLFAAIGLAAAYVVRLPGDGITPLPKVARVITWSSIGEGVGLFLAANIVINLHRPELLLPAMALVVGLHFLPIAVAARFGPFYILGTALVLSAVIGGFIGAPGGSELAGGMAALGLWVAAALGLWVAAALAVHRDWRAKQI